MLRREQKQFDESLIDLFESLMYNTQTTGNFAAFIRVFLRRAAELKTSVQCNEFVQYPFCFINYNLCKWIVSNDNISIFSIVTFSIFSKIFVWQTSNALTILTCICKFLTQRLSESEFVKVFNKNVLTDDGMMFISFV